MSFVGYKTASGASVFKSDPDVRLYSLHISSATSKGFKFPFSRTACLFTSDTSDFNICGGCNGL